MHRDMQSVWIVELAYIVAWLGLAPTKWICEVWTSMGMEVMSYYYFRNCAYIFFHYLSTLGHFVFRILQIQRISCQKKTPRVGDRQVSVTVRISDGRAPVSRHRMLALIECHTRTSFNYEIKPLLMIPSFGVDFQEGNPTQCT